MQSNAAQQLHQRNICRTGDTHCTSVAQANTQAGGANTYPKILTPEKNTPLNKHGVTKSSQEIKAQPIVIGITGCTRSGKSWLAKALSYVLKYNHSNNKNKAPPSVTIVGQDRFWRQPVLVTTTSGTQDSHNSRHHQSNCSCTLRNQHRPQRHRQMAGNT